MTKAFGADGRVRKGLKDVTISFGERFAASEKFDAIFRVGMAQVERAAQYLDGPGRAQTKSLAPAVAIDYATESMRLTTRLLSIASWLLVRRALRDGDITADEARAKRRNIKLHRIGRPAQIANFDELPATMRQLILDSHGLHDRIIQLDRALECGDPAAGIDPATVPINDVALQINRIEAAFSGQLPRQRTG